MTVFPVPVGSDLGDNYGPVYSVSAWVVIDGIKAPCTVADLEAGQPTVLDGLTFGWGRDTNIDQPDTNSCSFTMREQVVDVPGEGVNVVEDPGFDDPDLNATRFPADWKIADNTVTIGTDPVNMAFDPSFANAAGISAGGSAGLQVGGTANGFPVPPYGSTALSIAQSASGTDTTLLNPTAYVQNNTSDGSVRPCNPPMEPGKTYNASVYVYAKAGGTQSNANALKLNLIASYADGSQNSLWKLSDPATPNGTWQRLSISFTVPDDATRISVRLISNYVGQDPFTLQRLRSYWDGLQITEGAELRPYTDADNPNTTGTADSYRVWLIGNRLASTKTNAPTQPAPDNGAIEVEPGQQYALSIMARATINREVRWQVGTYDADGQIITNYTYVSSNFPLTAGEWTEVTGVFTVPDDVGYIAVAFVPESTFGGTVDIQNPSVSLTSRSTLDVIHVGSLVEVWAQAFYGIGPSGVPSTRTALAWTGEVTSLQTQAAGNDSFTTAVVASDLSSILQNARIGDDPWPSETVQQRANKIMAKIPGAPPLNIDSGLQSIKVSYRDVDAQPPFGLLQDLAQTAGGVLWITADAEHGAYLWMEDPSERASVRRFAIDDNGDVYITGGSGDGGVRPLSGCDVLQDPVTWVQDVSEVITQVTVSWLAQTTDDEGKPATEDRTVIVQDTSDAITRYGVRNVDISTELISEADAQDLADRILALSRGTGWRVDGLEYDAILLQRDIDSIPQPPRADLFMDMLDATLRIGLAVTLIDLPEWTPSGAVRSMYLDGGTYTFENRRWHLSLTATPSAGQGESATWDDFKGTGVTWEDFRAHEIRWVDAYGTAGPNV